MSFSTTITREYWLMKLEDLKKSGFFFEYKEISDFWVSRMRNISKEISVKKKIKGVFLVGSVPHHAIILSVEIVPREAVPERYRGAIHGFQCYRLKCTDEGGF